MQAYVRKLAEVVIRRARASDIPGILQLQYDCYPTLSQIAQWRSEHLESHQRVFPEGQNVAVASKRVVGLGSTFITRSEIALQPHTFRDITARGTFANHDPNGDTLYGAEIMVHPDMRRRGIASKLYEVRFSIARQLGLRYFVAGGRLPGYAAVRDEMSVWAYVQSVVQGRREDRVLNAQLRSGLRVAGVLPNYLTDPNSANYATLLVWENPLGTEGTSRPAEQEEAPPSRASVAERPGSPSEA